MNIQNIIAERINELYKQGVYVSEIEDKGRHKQATLDCVIPRTIFDDKKKIRYVKFINVRHVGMLKFSKDNQTFSEEPSERILGCIEDGFNGIRLRSEQIVLASVYDRLSKIAMIRTTLNPIYIILKQVYEGGFLKETLRTMGDKKKKYLLYLKFLCELGIIREQSDKYSEGNYFIELRKALSKEDEEVILNKVFGLTIRDGKTYLFNNLHFNVLKPFIRISNAYYSSSALVGEMVFMKKETLLENYNDLYELKVSPFKFESQIDQLNRAGILEEGALVSGKESIFSDVLKKLAV